MTPISLMEFRDQAEEERRQEHHKDAKDAKENRWRASLFEFTLTLFSFESFAPPWYSNLFAFNPRHRCHPWSKSSSNEVVNGFACHPYSEHCAD
jgi:hypothetical protein